MDSDDKFVEQYSNLVSSVARKTREQLGLECELADLVGFGYRGLLEAKKRFDPSRGVQFQSFAYYRIRGAIIDGVRKMSYLPRRAHARLRAAEVLDTEAELAGETRAGVPEMRSDLAANVRAIDAILGRIAAAYSISNAAAECDSGENSPEEILIDKERKQMALKAMEELPEREKVLIRGFYLDDRSLEELAREMGISKSWACRIHGKALDQLRRSFQVK